MILEQMVVYISLAISIMIGIIMAAFAIFRAKAAAEELTRVVEERNRRAHEEILQNAIETIDYHREQSVEIPTEDLVERIRREQEDGRSVISQKKKRDRYEAVRV